MNDWDTLGMRGTGSHTVELKDVFVSAESVVLRRPQGEFHPFWNAVLTVALPYIMSAYVGVAQKAASKVLDSVRKRSESKSHVASSVGAMMNQLTSAELHLADMRRLANDLDFMPTDQMGQDLLSRKVNVADACIGVVTKAMELIGGQGFYRGYGLERLFRDIQGANYHPLPRKDQQELYGNYLMQQG